MITRSLILFFVSTLTYAGTWPRSNDPFSFDKNLNLEFSQLPKRAEISENFTAWPGNHWANYKGGIAHRWSAGDPQNFTYHLNSLEELRKMESHLIDELSPAEKYDIYVGRYDYPTVRKVWSQNSPHHTEWFGICHGVAPAALNHSEPMSVTLKSVDGIVIHFYSSDVKALLSYQYAKVVKTPIKQIGRRCNSSENNVSRRQIEACNDLDPGAFHILITNYIGLKNKSMIVDIDRFNEVWNHVPKSYYYDVYNEYPGDDNSTPGTKKRLWIGLAVSYAAAIAPFFEPVIGLPQGYYVENNYQYFLDLDAKGNIIGGEWISNLRPDFIWDQQPAKFTGYWSSLNEIYLPRTE